MKRKDTRKLIMNACAHCGGAAYLEDPQYNEWRCLQCARTVPAPANPVRRTRTVLAA